MENLELEAARPELPQLETTTKKAKRKKRRSRKANRRPKQSPSPAVDSSTTSNSSSPTPTPANPKFDAACDEVLTEAGASTADSASGPDAETEGEPNPEFERMVKVYLSKPFKLLAFLLEDEEINLTPEQMEILVPEGALSLEEAWPHLPEWFKNSRWKHTYAFVFSFGLVAGENCARIYKRLKELKEQKKPPQPVQQFSTSMADSRESSATLLSPGGAKLI